MEQNTRYELACRLLPNRWRAAAMQLPKEVWEQVEELRLRVGQPATILLPEGEVLLQKDSRQTVTANELEQLCDLVCGYSRYAVSQTMAQGYLTAAGGFRVGICGTAVLADGVSTNLREISSAVIRVSREKRGIAEPLLPGLFEKGKFVNTLLLSPPGGGKTTLLRDLIRCLSDGAEGCGIHRVALADERGEVAGMYRGEPQFYVGSHTDVLDSCPKAIATEILVRSMNPQIIAVDEITAGRDLKAMEFAAYCGTALLATIHGKNLTELERKPLFHKLLRAHIFERAVTISQADGAWRYEVVPI